MANITDLFTKASNGTAPIATTLASQKDLGATSANLSLSTGWPTTTAVHGILYKVDANDVLVAGTVLVWKATLASTTLSNFTIKSGTDGVYAAGSVIELMPTSAWADDIITGLLVDHTQLGYHSSLHDSNGNTWIGQVATSSAVNYVKIANSVTGSGPTISPDGTDTNEDLNINSKGTGVVKINGSVPKQFFQNAAFNFIELGCTWSADSAGVNRNATMSPGFVWIAGKRLSVAAITGHTFTASKDTYVDFADNGDGTAKVIYTEVTNNAASPSTLSDASTFSDSSNIRNAIIITGASSIADSGSVNQGQETALLPITSSTPYAVTDSLGNRICPRDPQRRLLGYRQATGNQTATTAVDMTALSCPVNIPTGRKVLITGTIPAASNNTSGSGAVMSLIDATASATVTNSVGHSSTANANFNVNPANIYTPPASGARTFKAQFSNNAGGTASTNSLSTAPSWIKVELD